MKLFQLYYYRTVPEYRFICIFILKYKYENRNEILKCKINKISEYRYKEKVTKMSFSRATRRGTSNLSKSYSNHASESSIKVQKKNMKSSHVNNNNNTSSRAKIQRVKKLNATVTGMIKHLDQSIDRAMVCLNTKENGVTDNLLNKYVGPLITNCDELNVGELLEISNIVANNLK